MAAAVLGLKADQVRASGVFLAALVGRLAEQQLVAPFAFHLHLRGGVGKHWQTSAASTGCDVAAQSHAAMQSALGRIWAALPNRGRRELLTQRKGLLCHLWHLTYVNPVDWLSTLVGILADQGSGFDSSCRGPRQDRLFS